MRRSSRVNFSRGSRIEAVRYDAKNAENLIVHSVAWEALVKKHDITSDCIFHLDEAGMTPGKDADGRTRHKVYATRGTRPDERMPFRNCRPRKDFWSNMRK